MKTSEFNKLSKEEKSKVNFKDMPALNKFAARLFFICLALFVILVVFLICIPNTETKDIGPKMPSSSEAYSTAQIFVKRNLKSPKSADFSYTDYVVKHYVDSTYECSSYVDAKNSFNAEIRSQWYVKMKYHGDTKWTLLSIRIN